ncbi:MAG: 4Fe-4S dicluster domain-containing protein [Deltaproteobacteria bacterium]|nr:MAG: 4Fe-4S dicluster domain-containing protein [Deltaproteobacteria bacterium]
MARYGMVIDLSRCVGCSTCMAICKAEHCLPPGILWSRLLIKEEGKYPWVSKRIVPLLCNHCEDAACVEVCPSGATSKREDGIVTVDYDKCVGCGYCVVACPYGARSFYREEGSSFPGEGLTPYEKIGYLQFQTGVVTKCNFCQDRVDLGLRRGMQPGVDPEATPACVNACIAKARFFGDLDDPESEVSQLIRLKLGFQMRPEVGTNPSVYYLR